MSPLRVLPVTLVLALVAISTSVRAGTQVPISTMRVQLANGATSEFDGASADADWMRSWQSRPLERREVVLQGRAGGTSEVSHFRALGCTLLDARAAAAGYESVTLRCDLVLRTD